MITGEECVIKNNYKKREWLKYIDLNLLDIYPLQLANCDRLSLNDSVYIFDEVGSGKTISSGLMALDFLSNNNHKKVLVVTTNALFKKGIYSEYGQFLKDWFEKLPFKALNLESRIKVTNNHYSHFSRKSEYGLVIIDEAQLFLNSESMRYKLLTENISAQKVIFLTATPIKNSKYDLQIYVDIAKKITGKEISNDWIENISTVDKQAEQIICNTFDISSPVTRYFKDTIMSLNIEGYKKSQARRLLPHLWQYGQGKTKNEILLENINSKCEEDNKNNFVVFTRFVEKEAHEIASYLKKNGFIEHNNDNLNQKTYAVVTGENAYKLSEYSGTINLPTVLIVTYQIAEQGVNLPGYNHVVNYHISAFPSALEQRFGRIDRMGKNGSKFSEINICFLIAKDSWDTNTWNFYCAISIYLRNLISYLPSKNTILSEEVLEQYSQTQSLIEEYIEKITNLVNQDNQIRLIIEYFKELSNSEINTTNLECKCDIELFTFLEENSIEFNTDIDETEAIKLFKKEIKDTFVELKSNFGFKNGLSIDKYRTIIKSVSDKIFYTNGYSNNGISFENLRTLDAINECGKNISSKSTFLDYSKKFRENIKLPILISNYLTDFNKFFEESFNKNDFNTLFPFNGYKEIFMKLISVKFDKINKEDKNIILGNCEVIVKIVPFFKMCNEFKKCLKSMVYVQDGSIRIRFDFNPFIAATWQIGYKIKKDARQLGLSNSFVSLYCAEGRDYSDLFKLEYKDEVVQASNWYKLSYHYTRKEVACFMQGCYLKFEDNENLFYIKEKYMKFLGQNYKLYQSTYAQWDEDCFDYNSAVKVAMDGEDDDFDPKAFLEEVRYYGEPEYPELMEKYEEILDKFNKVCQSINSAEKDTHQSLFNHYIFTENKNFRVHINYQFKYYNKNCKVYVKDLWTQGILYEVSKATFRNCTWDNMFKLPDEVAKIPLVY
jgi:superfamily II DNA or RNA helicase